MALVNDNETDGGISLIWTIENATLCLQKEGEWLDSPVFVIDSLGGIKCFLRLYPRGRISSRGMFAEYFIMCDGLSRGEVDVALSIKVTDGTFKKVPHAFILSTCTEDQGITSFLSLHDLDTKGYDAKGHGAKGHGTKGHGSCFLENSALTLRCRLRRKDNDLWRIEKSHLRDYSPITVRYYARTRINVEHIAFVWRSFWNLPNKERPTKAQTTSARALSLTIHFLPGEGIVEDFYLFEIRQVLRMESRFSTCNLSLVNADGNEMFSVRDQVWLEMPRKHTWQIPFPKKKLLDHPRGIGTLSLYFEIAVSFGVNWNKVEKTIYGADVQTRQAEDFSPASLADDMRGYYAGGKYSDLIIRTASKDFLAHKAILCARSPVFDSMFRHDMRESRTGVVEIEDLDEDAIDKLLNYCYTDDVAKDLEWAVYSELYYAADKYGIESLKRKCSEFLKNFLVASNVLEVLVLADMHQDLELKWAAKEFIWEYSNEIVNSGKWKEFIQGNLPLAAEVRHLLN